MFSEDDFLCIIELAYSYSYRDPYKELKVFIRKDSFNIFSNSIIMIIYIANLSYLLMYFTSFIN